MWKRLILAAALVLTSAAAATAQATAFVVRHAERADSGGAGAGMMANDPDLSEAGRTRAAGLAAVLKDAGITAIYATEFKRTQQTAAPLSKAIGVPVTTVSSKDTAALIAKVKAASGNVLIVGHSNSVPDIVKGLGVGTPVTVGDDDYDNLFVVRIDGTPAVIRLHYR